MALINRIGQVTVVVPEHQNDRADPEPSNPFQDFMGLVPLGGILTVIWYGLTWLWVARFLSPFGLTPEEIGITPTWVLFRLPYFAAPVAIALMAVWAAVRLKGRVQATLYRYVQIAVVLLALSIAFVDAMRSDAGVLTFLADFSFVVLLLGVVDLSYRHSIRVLLISIVAGVIFALSAIGAYWSRAASGADNVSKGDVGSFSDAIGIPIVNVEPVNVYHISSEGQLETVFSRCASLLGSANGLTVILLSEPSGQAVTLRLPTDQIALRRGCTLE